MKTFHIELPDLQIREALIDKINNLTKPKGSLGVWQYLRVEPGSGKDAVGHDKAIDQYQHLQFGCPQHTADSHYHFVASKPGNLVSCRAVALIVVDCLFQYIVFMTDAFRIQSAAGSYALFQRNACK